jgi:predicted RNA-binding protein with PUA-like domain
MRPGDMAFFYHSSCEIPGIVGTIQIVTSARPDHTAFDKDGKYYDNGSSRDKPRWFLVDVKLEREFKRIIGLSELREHQALQDMTLLKKGSRLSVMPVTKSQWDYILELE